MSSYFRTFVRKHRTSRGHLSASIGLLADILFKYSASVVCPQGIRRTSAALRPAPTPPFFIILIILNILQYLYVHVYNNTFYSWFTYPILHITHYPQPCYQLEPPPPQLFFVHFLNNFNSSYTYPFTPLTGPPPNWIPPPTSAPSDFFFYIFTIASILQHINQDPH